MRHEKTIKLSLTAVWMLILILDGKTALDGMQDGLKICMETLIPALFPFLFLSSVISGNLPDNCPGFLSRLIRITGIPDYVAMILPIGWLGGYPIGARCASELHSSGSISVEEATDLTVICNAAGPAFLFGVLLPLFRDKRTVLWLWGIHLVSAVLVGSGRRTESRPAAYTHITASSFGALMNGAIRTMASVCGCVILFRTVLAFLDRWLFWLIPAEWNALCSGILELSNGSLRLSGIPDEDLRFLIASVLLGFGGICVHLQTLSVFPQIRYKLYLSGKLRQTVYSFILASAMIAVRRDHFFLGSILVLGIFLSTVIRKHPMMGRQNSGSNPASFDV